MKRNEEPRDLRLDLFRVGWDTLGVQVSDTRIGVQARSRRGTEREHVFAVVDRGPDEVVRLIQRLEEKVMRGEIAGTEPMSAIRRLLR
jgi:hypothetical protein